MLSLNKIASGVTIFLVKEQIEKTNILRTNTPTPWTGTAHRYLQHPHSCRTKPGNTTMLNSLLYAKRNFWQAFHRSVANYYPSFFFFSETTLFSFLFAFVLLKFTENMHFSCLKLTVLKSLLKDKLKAIILLTKIKSRITSGDFIYSSQRSRSNDFWEFIKY